VPCHIVEVPTKNSSIPVLPVVDLSRPTRTCTGTIVPISAFAAHMTYSEKVEVLVDGFTHIPSTAHPRWKRHKVSLSDRYRLSVVRRRHSNLTLQNITALIAIVRPRKLARLAAPRAPVEHCCFRIECIVNKSNKNKDNDWTARNNWYY